MKRVAGKKGTSAGGPKARYQSSDAPDFRVAEEAPVWGVKSARTVSATEAARNFSELINRVCYQREVIIIERGGKAMCELSPAEARRCSGAELLALLARLPRPADEFLSAVEEANANQAQVEPSSWDE